MSDVIKDLQTAFAGESQANRKYLAFAAQADKEGNKMAARLFRAAAEAETIHALSHLKAMGVVGDTKANLTAAVNGETYEFEKMYPSMIAGAKSADNKAAERSFNLANEAEKVHAELFKKALAGLDKKEAVDLYLCKVCGHIAEGEAPDQCPICKAKKASYAKVD